MPDTDFDKFDPNNPSEPMYGLWDGHAFVAKGRRAGLLTKFRNIWNEAKLYILEPNGWRCIAHKTYVENDETKMCDQCGQPCQGQVQSRYSYRNDHLNNPGIWGFVRQGPSSNKYADPLELRFVGTHCCDGAIV